MRREALILTAAALLIGCGPKPATIPQGWQTSKVEGITVAFPPDWIIWDITKKDFATTVNSPAIDKMRKIAQENAKQNVVKLMALDPAIQAGDFIASGNIIVLPDPKGDPKDERQLNEVEIGKLAVTSFHITRDKKLYLFTFSAPIAGKEAFRNTITQIAQSISQ